MKLKNVFTSGKMNKDSDERLIQKGEYRHALNVRVANSNGSDVGAVENALSNAKMSNISFGNNAKTIGVIDDDGANKVYWCVVSDSGSFVCEFSKDTSQAEIILSDNRSGDLNQLGFSEDNMVDMSILNDAENNKNFLFLTDGVTEPKYFEIETAKALTNNSFTFEDVSLIKSPPLTAPTITLEKTDAEEENYIQDKFFSFAYRYIYENDEISAISPFSEFAFMPDDFRYDYNSGTNKSMENKYNKVNVSFNTGSKNVKKIEILAKQSGENVTYVVEKLDKPDKGWSDNSTQIFEFTNSKVYKALPASQLLRIYDNVPKKAKTLDIIGNRIVFGNYTENYNVSSIPKLSLSYSSASGVKNIPHETVKSNMDYEVGISYLDGKGRMTTPFTSEGNTVHIPITKSDKKNSLSVGISSQAPEWATGYRLFIKQSKNDYDVISPVVFYKEGVYVYIKVEGEDVNKVKEGDFLFVKSDTSGIKNKTLKVKILESENKERNFLEDSREENTKQEQGNYIKINTEEISLDETSIDTFSYEGYAFRSRSVYNNVINPQDYVENTIFYGSGTNNINVTGSYNHPSDLRYEVKVISSGSPDLVEWRFLDCRENIYSAWDNNNGLGYSTASTISINNGLSISFSSSSGHQVDDRWVINAKSYDRPKSWDDNDDSSSGDDGRRAIMHFKTSESGSESIKAGSIITLEYDDTPSENYDNASGYVYQRFVSSSDYENLEEWFWEDDVISIMDYPEDLSDLMFRRGFLQKANGEQIRIDPTGDLYLMMLSQSNYLGGGKVRVDINLKVLQIDNPIIFETDYKFASSETFYELPKTYGISNRNHLGDVNQVFGTTNALVNLDHFNAFGWYNGYESIKIADGFNQPRMLIDSKPLVPLDNYKEITRIASLTYSGIYESTTAFNGVNEFNLSTANYKDIDPSFGKIAKIISRNGDLTVIQNNRVSRVLFNKSVIYNADGSGNVSQNNNVLGQEIPYQGEFGISNNIYSATKWNGDIYFADERRGSVIRLTDNGIFPISNYGMISWFNDHLYVGSKIVSSFDPNNDQFVLSLTNPNIQWVEDTYECNETITTTTTSSVTTTTTQCFVPVEIPVDACAINWIEDSYECNVEDAVVTWLENTYECNIEGTTTTTSTTTEAPVVTWLEETYECNIEGTTTTTSTTTAAPVVTWLEETYECNIEGTTTTTSTAAPTTTTTSTEAPTTTTTSTAAPTTTTTSTAAPTTTTTSTAAPVVTWLEETYECNIEGTTTTSTSAAPTTTTTTTAAPTTTTTTTAAPTTTTTTTAATTTTSTTTTTTNVPAGTLISTYCSGTTRVNTYADGNGGFYQEEEVNSVSCGYTTTTSTSTTTTTTNVPAGTLISTYCSGTTRVNIYADGSGGSYQEEEVNSVSCGYTTTTSTTTTTTNVPAGTLLSTSCFGVDLYGTYADGSGGSYVDLIESNSVSCGYTTTTSTSTTTTTTTTEDPNACYEYTANVPQQSGESLDVTYIDCDGIEQSFVYYWNGGISSVQWCARSIVGANYPVTGPGALCSGNSALPTTTTSTTTTTTTFTPSGTLLTTYCSGTTKIGRYADGSGGTYDQAIEYDSVDCGYVTPSGTLLSTYCDGTTKMGTYANGSGGSYNQVIEYNSTDCGYVYPAGTLLDTNCFGYDLFGTYADGSGGTYTDLIETNSTNCGYVAPTTQTPAGTLLSTYCDGTTKMGTYANGSGGSYNQVIEYNSTDCGYVTPAGTLLSTYCSGTTLYGTYANGSGGSYNQVIEYNSTSCGYVAPTTTTTQTPSGTLLSTYCSGTTLYGTYADGSGGSYNQVIEYNSTSCGYVAPTTTTTTTQPADNVFVVEATGVVGDYIQIAQGYSIGDFITTSAHGTTCVEIMATAYVVNPGAFGTIEGPCPPPTTTTTTTQPSTSGYSCVNGSCQFVSSGAQYPTLKACNLECGNQV